MIPVYKMHFRIRFLFDSIVNTEIDMTIWKFLPGTTRIGTFFSSGDIWFETDSDKGLPERLKAAIGDVFDYYKREDMFGYVESGYSKYLEKPDKLFLLSAFAPADDTVDKIKKLLDDIKCTEDRLFGLKMECGALFRELDLR
jgi:hypothetical protein